MATSPRTLVFCSWVVLCCGGLRAWSADKSDAPQGYTFQTLPEVIQKSLSVALHGRTEDITRIVRTTLPLTNGKRTGLLYVAAVPQANGGTMYLCLNDKGEIVERQVTKPGPAGAAAK